MKNLKRNHSIYPVENQDQGENADGFRQDREAQIGTLKSGSVENTYTCFYLFNFVKTRVNRQNRRVLEFLFNRLLD